MKNILLKPITVLIIWLNCFTQASFAQGINYDHFQKSYRYDSPNLLDSMRHITFERIVYDSSHNHLYAIMQTRTRLNDTQSYSFPVRMRLDPLNGDVLLQAADSLPNHNLAYTALLEYENALFWGGWETPKLIDDASQTQAVLIKSDKNLNTIWRIQLPNTLRMATVAQVKEWGDTIYVNTLHKSPDSANALFPAQAIRSMLWKLDTAGNVLGSILLSEDTTVLHAAYDFELLPGGDWLLAGRTAQWNGNGNAYSQRMSPGGQTVWHFSDSIFIGGSTFRKILRAGQEPENFYLSGTIYYSGNLGGFVESQCLLPKFNNAGNLLAFFSLDGGGPGVNFPWIVGDNGFRGGIATKSGSILSVGFLSVNIGPTTTTIGFFLKMEPDGTIWTQSYTEWPVPGMQTISSNYQSSVSDIIKSTDIFWDTLQWFATFKKFDEHLNDIVELPNGDLIMAGSHVSSFFHAQGHPSFSSFRRNAWLLRADSNGCMYVNCRGLSINDPKKDLFNANLYPNPAKSQIEINWKNEVTINHILVTNIIGQVQHQQKPSKSNNNTIIDVNNWAKGIYFIKLTNDKGAHTSVRFLKE